MQQLYAEYSEIFISVKENTRRVRGGRNGDVVEVVTKLMEVLLMERNPGKPPGMIYKALVTEDCEWGIFECWSRKGHDAPCWEMFPYHCTGFRYNIVNGRNLPPDIWSISHCLTTLTQGGQIRGYHASPLGTKSRGAAPFSGDDIPKRDEGCHRWRLIVAGIDKGFGMILSMIMTWSMKYI